MPRPALPRAGRRPPGAPAAVVVLAGGSGTRVGAGLNKVYLPLAGRTVLTWSLTWARQVGDVGAFVVVVRPEDAELAERTLHREAAGMPVRLVVGGSTRHESEEAALRHLATDIDSGAVGTVAVHDGARPLAGPGLWRSVIGTARAVGGAVPALPADDVLGVGPEGTPAPGGGPPVSGLVRVQTPQAFRGPDLLAAFEQARAASFQGTDTCATAEAYSTLAVRVVAGRRTNMKITFPHDLVVAEQLLSDHGYRLP